MAGLWTEFYSGDRNDKIHHARRATRLTIEKLGAVGCCAAGQLDPCMLLRRALAWPNAAGLCGSGPWSSARIVPL